MSRQFEINVSTKFNWQNSKAHIIGHILENINWLTEESEFFSCEQNEYDYLLSVHKKILKVCWLLIEYINWFNNKKRRKLNSKEIDLINLIVNEISENITHKRFGWLIFDNFDKIAFLLLQFIEVSRDRESEKEIQNT